MKGTISINRELCKGCGYCIDTCPLGVIVVEENFNKKGVFPASPAYLEKCTGCCMCARMCPEIAIEVYREENEEEICNRD
jgi:2-oxoglutarate ferredoxin oxidoreductase subunit delta